MGAVTGAQRKTQSRKMVLRHGGAPLVAESGVMIARETMACLMMMFTTILATD